MNCFDNCRDAGPYRKCVAMHKIVGAIHESPAKPPSTLSDADKIMLLFSFSLLTNEKDGYIIKELKLLLLFPEA